MLASTTRTIKADRFLLTGIGVAAVGPVLSQSWSISGLLLFATTKRSCPFTADRYRDVAGRGVSRLTKVGDRYHEFAVTTQPTNHGSSGLRGKSESAGIGEKREYSVTFTPHFPERRTTMRDLFSSPFDVRHDAMVHLVRALWFLISSARFIG